MFSKFLGEAFLSPLLSFSFLSLLIHAVFTPEHFFHHFKLKLYLYFRRHHSSFKEKAFKKIAIGYLTGSHFSIYFSSFTSSYSIITYDFPAIKGYFLHQLLMGKIGELCHRDDLKLEGD